jgi:hypothetical protein
MMPKNKVRKEHLQPHLLQGLASGDANPMTTTDWDSMRAAVHQNQRSQTAASRESSYAPFN